jgi:3-oxoacyl-[acyl-carrier-protein] synthase III
MGVPAMQHAAIVGWGKCLPPAVLSNKDLESFFETSDDWITQRTGIHERRVSHVLLGEMAYVAAERALAAAGFAGRDVELIVFGTCSHDEQVPNMASGLQRRIGAPTAAAMDVNTACTSFLYGLSTATAMIKNGIVKNALVIGAELISPFMDWTNRNVAVLFGDGAAAVVLQATDKEEGVLAEKLGCYGESRDILAVHGMGGRYANLGKLYGECAWQFDGPEVFKRAVHGMSHACEEVMTRRRVAADAIDLVVPHQANLRIIEAVAKKTHVPMERVYVNVHRYGNMSSATVPVALCEALEEGRIRPGATVLFTGFGGGLTWCAHLVRWGERVKPLGTSPVELPPCEKTAVEMIRDVMTRKRTFVPPGGD